MSSFDENGEVMEDDPVRETWLNLYASRFSTINLPDDSTKEFDPFVNAIIQSLFVRKNNEINESDVFLQGLDVVRSFFAGAEYPKAEITIKILEFLKNGIEQSVDQILCSGAFRLVSQLLASIPPWNQTLSNYWRKVLYSSLGGQMEEFNTKKNATLRLNFLDLIEKIAQIHEPERRQAAGAYLAIICEILEIDFFWFLQRNLNVVCSDLLMSGGGSAPLIALIFWPCGLISDQEGLLKHLLQILTRAEDVHTSDVCGRLFAMLFEVTRLSGRDELPDWVLFEKLVPRALRSLLKKIFDQIETKAEANRLLNATAFGWIKKEIQSQLHKYR